MNYKGHSNNALAGAREAVGKQLKATLNCFLTCNLLSYEELED